MPKSLSLIKRHKAWLAAGLFAAAILLASTGLLYLPVALAIVVVAYVLFNILPARQVYDSIEWPVIVLLGSMIPARGGTGNKRRYGPDCRWLLPAWPRVIHRWWC